jgi:hypothetical protein
MATCGLPTAAVQDLQVTIPWAEAAPEGERGAGGRPRSFT